eukprot:scaffold166893_cov63-Cyclotella_meneghiniana.AAC.3
MGGSLVVVGWAIAWTWFLASVVVSCCSLLLSVVRLGCVCDYLVVCLCRVSGASLRLVRRRRRRARCREPRDESRGVS